MMRRARIRSSMRAHPRSRGENVLAAPMIVLIWGSSPLTRGKSPPRAPTGSWMPAHPRSRGENDEAWAFDAEAGRLIPAHAGKIVAANDPHISTRAHPRSRGENHIKRSGVSQTTGSSPLTRGKCYDTACALQAHGLIPAHAGKITPVGTPPPLVQAHPRSRGENMPPATTPTMPPGSSPLTRGKCQEHRVIVGRPRLIPAHAGKIVGSKDAYQVHWAHPRSRGENRAA